MAKAKVTEEILEFEVSQVMARQQELATMMASPQVKQFLDMQASINDYAATVWKKVESDMIDSGIKSIKGDWGSITVAERNNYAVADIKMLPAKFKKTVPDTTKIGQAYKLEGKPPKGVLVSVSQYLVKRLK